MFSYSSFARFLCLFWLFKDKMFFITTGRNHLDIIQDLTISDWVFLTTIYNACRRERLGTIWLHVDGTICDDNKNNVVFLDRSVLFNSILSFIIIIPEWPQAMPSIKLPSQSTKFLVQRLQCQFRVHRSTTTEHRMEDVHDKMPDYMNQQIDWILTWSQKIPAQFTTSVQIDESAQRKPPTTTSGQQNEDTK